jgi:hypothetical protein
MPPINFNKLLANEENINELLKQLEPAPNVEKTSNYNVRNRFHIDNGLNDNSIKVTKPSLVMFNAIVNKSFSKTNRKLELGMIAKNIVETKLPFEKYTFKNNGISIEVKKVTGRHGRLQPAFTITNAYAHTGADIFDERVFVLEFLVTVSIADESVNTTVALFNNGKIKISGGYLNQRNDNMNNEELFEAQPEMVRQYIVNNYTNKEKFLRNNFEFNNVVSEVRFNRGFNLYVISGLVANSKNFSVRYNPELSANMFIKRGDYDYVMSPRGLVKIQGITEYDDIEESYEFILDFINTLTAFEKGQKPNARGRIKRAFLNVNLTNRTKKKAAVFGNVNKPAPEVTRRGTTCPPSRRPAPYSMQGKCPQEGCYVKPNPQGQPCCYKIPKKIAYSEKKVFEAFKKANVKVPNMVRKVFNFGLDTNNKRNNTTHANLKNLVVKINSKVGLKVGSRQCLRYSKVALVDIAHRLGIPVTPGVSKERLCDLIQTFAKNVTNTNNVKGARAVTFTNANKVFAVTGNSMNALKIGGRIAKTIKREKLMRYAFKLGARPTEIATIADLCKMIYDRYVALKPKSPSPSPVRSPTPNAGLAALKKYRLTSNLVEDDVKKFLGPKWIAKRGVSNNSISKKATELYEMLARAINKNNLQFDITQIKEFKKAVLRNWKMDTDAVARVRARIARSPTKLLVKKVNREEI